MPYAGHQPDPYNNGYADEGHDLYSTPEAYPPPQPPGQRQAPAVPEVPEQGREWDAEPEEENHPFFTGADDGEREDDDPRESRRGTGGGGRDRRGKTKKKGKSGRACLILAVVFAVGVGGVGYVGYDFYQKKFGAAPDYVGEGSSETVTVEIPTGAGGSEIGQLLKQAGVVKSIDAFVQAQNDDPKGKTIQAGAYTMKKGMSAANAVKLMLNPSSRNSLIIPEGKRNSWVYGEIDTRLGLRPGTTKDIALKNADSMGLPDWAKGHKNVKDPLEGFLYPASYPVAKGMKPEDVLKKMVNRASSEYGKQDLAAEAKKLNLDGPWQLITVASLVQAEGKTHDDFRKMAEVVYNRLKPDNTQTNQKLQFDSAYNYLTGKSNIKIGLAEINSNPDPYNTYKWRGLTPGPIGNPGTDALAAALNPTNDGWMYFVATDGEKKTEFAKTLTEFNKLKMSSMPSPASEGARRAAVLGSPIAHSLSPVLHRAAYAELGLGHWSYDRFEVGEAALPASSRARRLLGRALADDAAQAGGHPAARRGHATAASVEAVNTVVFTDDGRRLGDNTDIPGMIAALGERGVTEGRFRRRARRGRDRLVRARGPLAHLHGPGHRLRTQRRPRPGDARLGRAARRRRAHGRLGGVRRGVRRAAGHRDHPGRPPTRSPPRSPSARHAVRRAVRPVADTARHRLDGTRRGRRRRPRSAGAPGGAAGGADDGPRPPSGRDAGCGRGGAGSALGHRRCRSRARHG